MKKVLLVAMFVFFGASLAMAGSTTTGNISTDVKAKEGNTIQGGALNSVDVNVGGVDIAKPGAGNLKTGNINTKVDVGKVNTIQGGALNDAKVNVGGVKAGH